MTTSPCTSVSFVNKSKRIRIALVSTFHLANNPRLVKQADALSQAGYEVDVFATKYLDWPDAGDRSLLAGSSWSVQFVDYHPVRRTRLFWYSRVRKKLAKAVWRISSAYLPDKFVEWIAFRALERVYPEIYALVLKKKSDLYIAHGVAALPIAVKAAAKNQGVAGFDFADFHPGMVDVGSEASCEEKISLFIERRYIKKVKQFTAASPGIADAISRFYRLPLPASVLNVFPLRQRPEALRSCSESGPITLCWFSQTIGRDRGLNDAVGACALLPPGSVELHLRGAWAIGYEEEFKKLWQQEVGERAKLFVQGPVPPTQLVKAVAQFDIGLALEIPISENRLICMRDLCTNKVFTYLLAGLAVAASGIEGCSSIFEGAGFTYPTGDPGALASGIGQWVDNRAALQHARSAAWRVAGTCYNWDIEQEKFIATVKEVLRN
jgi:glycosyltransferase involved in cell wall biosynthesis